jgi:hypothetical protein
LSHSLKLLPSQKNDTFQAIKNIGLNPSDFLWKETKENYFDEEITNIDLCFRATEFHFLFTRQNKGWWLLFSPSYEIYEDNVAVNSWEAVSHTFRRWLSYLKSEIEAPDLWSTIADEKAIVLAAADDKIENELFSSNEQKIISSQLSEIKAYLIQTQDLNEQQAEQVNRRLDYLAEASTRMGRKDWFNLALGVITGIAIQLFFQPNIIHDLFQVIGNLLRPILGGPLPLS